MPVFALRGPMLSDGDETLIVFDGAISETHAYEADITEHEVEEGSPITDHIRLRPIEVTIQGIVSATPLHDEWSLERPNDAWYLLVAAHEQRRRLTLSTGLDAYDDMVIVSLTESRAPHFAIQPSMVLRQIRIVSGQEVTLPEEVIAPRSRASGTSGQNEGKQATEELSPRQQRAAELTERTLAGAP